ncbi:MAG: apolipoprotein N-acyltransferase [Rhizorhabdus sp.]|nr:apolipoprotein N-acyltransferase [Rhizorhabdus sp.]
MLIAFALGIASALGFAPLNWWPLTLLAFAGLMWVALRAPRLRGAAAIGYGFGIGHFAIGLNWIAMAFTFQDAMPHWLGWIAVFALSLYIAVYPMAAVAIAWWLADRPLQAIRRRIVAEQADHRASIARFVPADTIDQVTVPAAADPGQRNPYAFILLFAASWVICEYLRALLFTGFAWNPLSAIMMSADQVEPAFYGLTRVIGTYGLSGIMILLAGIWLIAILPGDNRQRWRRVSGAIIAAMLLQIASAALLRPLPPRTEPRIRVVQPNIGQQDKWNETFEARNNARLAALSGKPGPQPRLILWPEAATSDFLEVQPEARARIAALLGPKDIILTGADSLEWSKDDKLIGAHNSLFAMDARGQLLGRYDKAHLVPYGEYLPMRPILSAIGLSRLAPGDLDFWSGPGPATMTIPGFGKAGIQICYEIIFSGQVVDRNNRPDFLFNPSNDAWFGSWGPPQHLAQARLRAAEEAMPIIRSTPTGISAVIDADGRLLHSLPWRKPGAIDAALPAPHPPTLFSRFGNILPMLFALLLGAAGIAISRKRR